MRVPRKSSIISRAVAWAAAIWLCAAGSAFAGDGGASLGSLQTIIDGLCTAFNMNICPQLPTISQAVLEVAALENSPPEMVRPLNSIDPGNYVDAGNPSILLPADAFPFSPSTLQSLLSSLRPLAFTGASNSNGPAKATQLFNSAANAFLYAVASGPPPVGSSQLPVPDTLYFFYDDSSRTNSNFSQGQIVAKFSLPLTVLNSDGVTEREVAATLQFRSSGAGGQPCRATLPAAMSPSTVVGDFAGTGTGTQTYGANQIGVDCAVVFAPSPISSKAHAIFLVKLRLLVTQSADPLYFYFANTSPPSTGPVNFGIPSAFFPPDVTGFTPSPPPVTNPPTPPILGANGKSIGIAPSAAPQCTGPTGTPGTGIPGACSVPPPSGIFALCANLPGNGNGQPPVPSVAAFYAIGTDGETFLSAPIVPSSPIACPTMPG
jgi:hypothetical protein